MNKGSKITVIGDSVSKGVILEDNKIKTLETNAVHIVGEYLNTKIENNSIFGQTLQRVYTRGILEKYLNAIDENERNVLVLSLGGNDCDFNWQDVAKDPKKEHSSKTSPMEFLRYLDEITQKLLKKRVKVLFTTLFPVDSNRYFNNVISKLCEGEKVLDFLDGDLSNIHRHQEVFNEMICYNANKYGCKIIDIRTLFLLSVNYLSFVSSDGIHPNNAGQNKIAQQIIQNIYQY